MDVLPAHLNRDSFRDSFKGLVALEIILDLPFGFPINNIISLTAVGVPLPPTLLNLIYLAGRPNVIRADWALPVDTGLGDGSLNREQSLYRYTLHINGVKVLLVTELNISYIATGLTSGMEWMSATCEIKSTTKRKIESAIKCTSGSKNESKSLRHCTLCWRDGGGANQCVAMKEHAF